MESEKKSLYENFDDGVMYLVNKGVRAWNWTTGREKDSLANFLNVCGTAIQLANDFSRKDFGSSLLELPPYFIINYMNDNVKREEIIARKRECLVNPNSIAKKVAKFYGTSLFLIGLTWAISSISSEKPEIKQKYISWSVGTFSQALSLYVSRADYLPPRKNVLSRAKDKLVEILNQAEQVPQPVMVPVNYVGK